MSYNKQREVFNMYNIYGSSKHNFCVLVMVCRGKLSCLQWKISQNNFVYSKSLTLPPLFLVYKSSALLEKSGLLSIPESLGDPELSDSDSDEVLLALLEALKWLNIRLASGGDLVCGEEFWLSSIN